MLLEQYEKTKNLTNKTSTKMIDKIKTWVSQNPMVAVGTAIAATVVAIIYIVPMFKKKKQFGVR